MDTRNTSGLQLSISGIKKAFGSKPAIAIDSLDIESGSITVLLGRSGCGKSTLLGLVGGFIKPDSGTITHDGFALDDSTSETAIVFQQNNLFPWMSAADNLTLALRNFGKTPAQAHKAALQLLSDIGLRSFADFKPAQLSGGMRQRVALARALATSPRLLMLDEPFSALDVQTRRLMQGYLLQVWERTRSTVLMVTHDLDEALALADRIVLMGSQPVGHISRVIDINNPRSKAPDDPEIRKIASELNVFLEREARESEHFNFFD
jgi:NitT/TauT family transport system ATP-binding protein